MKLRDNMIWGILFKYGQEGQEEPRPFLSVLSYLSLLYFQNILYLSMKTKNKKCKTGPVQAF